MHRTTKLVLALAATTVVLLGVGTLQYAWYRSGPKPSATSPIGQVRAEATIPAAPPTAAPSAAVAPAAPMVAPDNAPPTSASTVIYVVQPHDTLWALAGAHLGNPLRWQELYDLNRGRLEPGGQALVNSDVISAGWTLEIPAEAGALPASQGPATSSGGQST